MKHYPNTPSASDSGQFVWVSSEINFTPVTASPVQPAQRRFAPLQPLRQWLDGLVIDDQELAHLICRMIPAQCPFERRFTFLGRTILYIPPLCKLNPLYDQFVGLRFRALCYLADVCGEDVTAYC
jgi:hypothetical protein